MLQSSIFTEFHWIQLSGFYLSVREHFVSSLYSHKTVGHSFRLFHAISHLGFWRTNGRLLERNSKFVDSICTITKFKRLDVNACSDCSLPAVAIYIWGIYLCETWQLWRSVCSTHDQNWSNSSENTMLRDKILQQLIDRIKQRLKKTEQSKTWSGTSAWHYAKSHVPETCIPYDSYMLYIRRNVG